MKPRSIVLQVGRYDGTRARAVLFADAHGLELHAADTEPLRWPMPGHVAHSYFDTLEHTLRALGRLP